MADRGVDMSALPKEVRDHLAELDLELSEGRCSLQTSSDIDLKPRTESSLVSGLCWTVFPSLLVISDFGFVSRCLCFGVQDSVITGQPDPVITVVRSRHHGSRSPVRLDLASL
ncbi:unnamed protein product [Boreogadus saida]